MWLKLLEKKCFLEKLRHCDYKLSKLILGHMCPWYKNLHIKNLLSSAFRRKDLQELWQFLRNCWGQSFWDFWPCVTSSKELWPWWLCTVGCERVPPTIIAEQIYIWRSQAPFPSYHYTHSHHHHHFTSQGIKPWTHPHLTALLWILLSVHSHRHLHRSDNDNHDNHDNHIISW